MRVGALVIAGLGIGLLVVGCGSGGIDWSAPESLIVREESDEKDGGVELQYWSLIDSPCKPIYDALVDFEHYREFIPGVDSTSLLGSTADTKTILIAQRVIGRQNVVELFGWTRCIDRGKNWYDQSGHHRQL